MVGQKDNSKAVGTKALMTVFHPQDVENLDPKMVGPRFLLIASTFQIMPLIQINKGPSCMKKCHQTVCFLSV